MKRFSVIAIVLILILSFAACSSKAASQNTSGKSADATGKETAETANQDAVRDFAEKLDPDSFKWPKERLHPDMPEFKKGKMNPWAGDNYEIYTLINEVSKADMEAYEKELLDAGFTLDGTGRYHKDLFDVTLKMNSDTILEISSYKTEVIGWPEALSAIPPVNAGDLDIVDFNEDVPDSIALYYINLSREKLEEWRKALGAKGFNVEEDTMKTENISFNGKTYAKASIWYEENGTNEWNVYFEFEN